MAEKIRKGDTVEVRGGRSKGVRGRVMRIDTAKGRVYVEKANMVSRHSKPSAKNRQGGIIEKEAPIALSRVALVHKGECTRVGFRVVDGVKVRWSKRHDEAIDG